MYLFLLIIHVAIAVLLVISILLQQGRGAQTGAAFGSGASTTVFGSQGAGSFLSRLTWTLVALFFGINLLLATLTNRYSQPEGVIMPSQTAAPAQGSVNPDIPVD